MHTGLLEFTCFTLWIYAIYGFALLYFYTCLNINDIRFAALGGRPRPSVDTDRRHNI